MKKLLLPVCLLLLAGTAFGQKDTINRVQAKSAVMPATTLRPATLRIKETEKILKEIEIKLAELDKAVGKLKDQKDAISEMSQQDMLMLQQLMEKKNQLEQMISNSMKAASDAMQKLAQNLKAS